jgi:serine/threonine protein kinase
MTSVKIRHHPNLVTLIGIAEFQNEYYIINEFCNGVSNLIIQATLFDFLHESNHTVSIKVKLSIAKQIARGMLFLHTNDPPIIHRDLKSLKYFFYQVSVLLVNKYNGET